MWKFSNLPLGAENVLSWIIIRIISCCVVSRLWIHTKRIRIYKYQWKLSSQLWSQLQAKKVQKKFWGSNGTDSNPWPPRIPVRCSTETELWSLVGNRSSASWIYTCYTKRVRLCVYDIDHMYELRETVILADMMQWLKKLQRKPRKNSEANPWPPRYLCDKASLEAGQERVQFISPI